MSARQVDTSVCLREARPQDFTRLWEIDQICFPPGISYSMRELQAGMRSPRAFTLIAEVTAEANIAADTGTPQIIAGFLVGHVERGRGHIITIDVLPQHRRRGIGNMLMREAELRLRAAGASAIVLETAVNNKPALSFYHRLGYRVEKVLRRYYDGELDGLSLVKPLA